MKEILTKKLEYILSRWDTNAYCVVEQLEDVYSAVFHLSTFGGSFVFSKEQAKNIIKNADIYLSTYTKVTSDIYDSFFELHDFLVITALGSARCLVHEMPEVRSIAKLLVNEAINNKDFLHGVT